MKNQNRGNTTIIAMASIALLFLVGLFTIFSYVSAANYGNEAETALTAKYNDNKNILGQYTIKIGEMAQVTDMQRDDLQKVIKATFEGRYGDGGSKAAFQWIKEQNPNLNPEVYNRLQVTMEAGRNDFTTSQTEILDMKRAYQTNLGYVWKGFWLKMAGYPKMDLTKINIVVASDTDQKFEVGVDEGIKLRQAQ